MPRLPLALLPLPLALAACTPAGPQVGPGVGIGAPDVARVPDDAWARPSDSTHRVAVVTGLAGPEAVRYDPAQDVYFVANFGPRVEGGGARDANGFISRLTPDGRIAELRFMTGTAAAPLHQPRGMVLRADTLWVADADGVHGFLARTGAHAAFIDFTALEPGFLNDIALDASGRMYITDTGKGRVYRVDGRAPAIAVEDPRTGPPNGITWDAAGRRFLLAPWGTARTLRAYDPSSGAVTELDSLPGGRFDGIEIFGDAVLIASQRDSSIHALRGGVVRPLIRTTGAPADIGIDTRRRRIAVPYIALDRVDIWALPERR